MRRTKDTAGGMVGYVGEITLWLPKAKSTIVTTAFGTVPAMSTGWVADAMGTGTLDSFVSVLV